MLRKIGIRAGGVGRLLLAFPAALMIMLLLSPTGARAAEGSLTGVTSTQFTVSKTSEVLLDVTAVAPPTSWTSKGSESAVLTVELDGQYKEDIVLFAGDTVFTYQVSLGGVASGTHTARLSYNTAKSTAGAQGAEVKSLATELVSQSSTLYNVIRHSPIIYGRNLSTIDGAYENNYTDVPAVMYHTSASDSRGNTTIEYSVIWSNEDGGTSTPALMARWGRSTDIEWAYRVKLDKRGRVVSEVYHGVNHSTLTFSGAKEGRHPLLVTNTVYNTFDQVTDPNTSTRYRFFIDPSQPLPSGRAREAVMDNNGWSYRLMAQEMIREGKIETTPNLDTVEVSDQRNYAYLEMDKDTAYTSTPSSGSWVGVALAIRLKNGTTWYSSHHNQASWSIQRDVPAATTVELPAGTSPDDVAEIKAVAVPVNTPPSYTITFTDINRGFFLDTDYRPMTSFIDWAGAIKLTPNQPEATIWRAP